MVNTSDILPNTPRYLKVPLIFFNAILWILGLLLIILGAVVLNALQNVDGLNINVGLASGLIVLGVFIIILTVVGSVVAFKEQLVGLIVYTVIMLILLICLIGVGGAAFSYRGETEKALHTAWGKADEGVRDNLQKYFECCGWEGNYTANTTFTTGGNTVQCITLDAVTYTVEEVVVKNITDPTASPTATPTATPTDTPTVTPTVTPTDTPTVTPTDTPTVTPTVTPTDSPTDSPTRRDSGWHLENVTISYNVTNYTKIPNLDHDCAVTITDFVRDRLYIAGVAGVVIGVIEFVCMFFSLYLIVRLCRNPRSRSYD